MATAVGPRALLTAIAAGAVAVLALWWHSTLSLAGFGGWLTGAGEILGLLAGYSVVVLVLLMARIRPIERAVGTSTPPSTGSSGAPPSPLFSSAAMRSSSGG